jgi:hypothetical protein
MHKFLSDRLIERSSRSGLVCTPGLADLGELLHFADEFGQHGEDDDKDPDEDEDPDPNGFHIEVGNN